jgi:hypothetical protein
MWEADHEGWGPVGVRGGALTDVSAKAFRSNGRMAANDDSAMRPFRAIGRAVFHLFHISLELDWAQVARVWYPGLESHPDHAIAVKQMSNGGSGGGFGGVVSFEVWGCCCAPCQCTGKGWQHCHTRATERPSTRLYLPDTLS